MIIGYARVSVEDHHMTGAEWTLARYHARQAVKRELQAQGFKLAHYEACEITRTAFVFLVVAIGHLQ